MNWGELGSFGVGLAALGSVIMTFVTYSRSKRTEARAAASEERATASAERSQETAQTFDIMKVTLETVNQQQAHHTKRIHDLEEELLLCERARRELGQELIDVKGELGMVKYELGGELMKQATLIENLERIVDRRRHSKDDDL